MPRLNSTKGCKRQILNEVMEQVEIPSLLILQGARTPSEVIRALPHLWLAFGVCLAAKGGE